MTRKVYEESRRQGQQHEERKVIMQCGERKARKVKEGRVSNLK
jgi:hypothetical protein